MTLIQLGEMLSAEYNKAGKKQKVTSILVFSIKHYENIQKFGIKEVLESAKLPSGYAPEISKGLRLSKYVVAI
jgi:hypothetical protein